MHIDPVRLIQLRLFRRTIDPRRAALAGARYAHDLPFLRNVAADQVVLRVGDQDGAIAVDPEVLRPVELRLPGVAAIAAGAGLTGAHDRADLAARIDNPQGMAAALQDVDIPLAVRRYRARIDQRRL